MRIALLQMRGGIEPEANAACVIAALREAKAGGAVLVFTPEMTGLLDRDGERAAGKLREEADDLVLRAVRDEAQRLGLWVSLGSLAIRSGDGRLVNRSFLIDAAGTIRARYDKLHLFDVDLPTGESWRESNRYAAGSQLVLGGETPVGPLGMSICYDLRFPALYQALSDAGAKVLAVPAAFTVPTGLAHWHILLRARAIENAAFVVAAAQVGRHQDGRETFGHSLVVGPWGNVLLDLGADEGVGFCDIDPGEVDAVRGRLPVVVHRRSLPQPVIAP